MKTHRLLHFVCHDAALQLGRMATGEGPGTKPPFAGVGESPEPQ